MRVAAFLIFLGSSAAWAQGLPPLGACVDYSFEAAVSIHRCMSSLLGPSLDRPVQVEPAFAAMVCQQARTSEAARAIPDCVRRLMFERQGLGGRRAEVGGDAATVACRFATSVVAGEIVEDCMRRLLYAREGLGERTSISARVAAAACQSSVTGPTVAFPYAPYCGVPTGTAAVEFLEECVKRLGPLAQSGRLSADWAVLACEGALAPVYPLR